MLTLTLEQEGLIKHGEKIENGNIKDARRKQKLRKFVFKTTSRFLYQQIIWIYTGIQLKLKFKPIKDTIIIFYFQELETAKKHGGE